MYQQVQQIKEESTNVNDFVNQVREVLQQGIQSNESMASDFEDEDFYDINWNELVEHLTAE